MKLTLRQRLLTAFTLFGMFFGAGNLIFPVHLGQLSGSSAIPAMIGFCITAVGIPILGVAAIGFTHSDGLLSLAGKVSKGYGYFFTCLLYLTIGPFFAIPRLASTSFTTGISPVINSSEQPWLLLYSGIFFAAVLFFSLKPGKITVWIGKIINPLFLAFLAVLVLAALINPPASISAITPAPEYSSGAFFESFIEGYGTMDAIAGLAFGIVVINIIKEMGVEKDETIAGEVLKSGILAGALMVIVYVVTILMGAQSRGAFALSDNGGIALSQIAYYCFGDFGTYMLAGIIISACLKTAIGLVTSIGTAFNRMFPRVSYKMWAIIFTCLSFAISNVGLSAIISYSTPVLMFIYPLGITLIATAFIGKFFKHDRCIYISVTAFTTAAAIFDFLKALPSGIINALHLEGIISLAGKILPFYELGLGWVIPALLGLAIGIVIHFSRCP